MRYCEDAEIVVSKHALLWILFSLDILNNQESTVAVLLLGISMTDIRMERGLVCPKAWVQMMNPVWCYPL